MMYGYYGGGMVWMFFAWVFITAVLAFVFGIIFWWTYKLVVKETPHKKRKK